MATMAANKRFTLVIDPGHGGKDQGAAGALSCEKDLTLKFGLAFGKMVEQQCPDVKVIYTRTTDVFLPLVRRAEIANKNHADLFISVHINSLDAGRQASGVQTYTLGKGKKTGKSGIAQNLEVAKRENAVIFLEKNYQHTYKGFDPNSAESNIMFEFMQDVNMHKSVELAKYMQRCICQATGMHDMGAHQDNLAVLRLSSMPGCLLELGFISTADDEKFMNSPQAVQMYTKGFFDAFMTYKNKYYQGVTVPYKASVVTVDTIPSVIPVEYKQSDKTARQSRINRIVRNAMHTSNHAEQAAASTKNDSTNIANTSKNDAVKAPITPKNDSKYMVAAPTDKTLSTFAATNTNDDKVPVVLKDKKRNAPQNNTVTAKPQQKKINIKVNHTDVGAEHLIVPTDTSIQAIPKDVPVFKVQIFSSSRKISMNSVLLKNLRQCDCYLENNMWKYTCGSSINYNEIRRLRKELVTRFPEAFIIAFVNGHRTDSNVAIHTFLKNKKK